MSRKKKIDEQEQNKTNHRKLIRSVWIKLGVNMILEFLGILAIIATLLIVQKRAACDKQDINSEQKIDSIAEILIDNESQKEMIVSKFDEFYVSKSLMLAEFFRANPDQLDKVLTKPEGKDILKDISADNHYNLDGLIVFSLENDAEKDTVIYSKKAEGITREEFNQLVDFTDFYPYMIDQSANKLLDVFEPFTYNHSKLDVINGFETKYGDDEIVSRYYGCKIIDGAYVLVGQEPSRLFDEISAILSLNNILSDITVGKNGYMLALDDNLNIMYSPDENLIGTKVSKFSIKKNGKYTGWLKVGGSKLYCMASKLDESFIREKYEELGFDLSREDVVVGSIMASYGDMTFMVAAVTSKEINNNRAFTCAIGGIAFTLISAIQIAYCFFVKREEYTGKSNGKVRKLGNLYFNVNSLKKITPVTLIGILLIIIITSFSQSLYSISNQIDMNATYLDEVTETLASNDRHAENLKYATDQLYLNKLDILKYTLLNKEEIHELFVDSSNEFVLTTRDDMTNEERNINKRYLKEISDNLGVRNIYLFNIEGDVIATSSNYQDFSLSTDKNTQSYEFWDILKGYKPEIVQSGMIDEYGTQTMYIAKPLQKYYGDFDDVVGMVQMEIDPNDYMDKLSSCEIDYVLRNMQFGTKGFAFAIDKNTRKLLYYPGEFNYDIQTKDALEFGISKAALNDGFFNSIKLEGKSYWVSSREYNDYYVYIAIPTKEVLSNVINITVAIAIIDFVMLSLFTLINVTSNKGETELIELVRNAEVKLGRDKKGNRHVLSRWDGSIIAWNSRSAGQKLSVLVSVAVALFALVLSIMLFTSVVSDLSIVSFIANNEFDKGMNLFSVTNVIGFAVIVIVASSIVRLCIRLSLRHSNARVATVGRLVSNIIKYVVIIWIIFRSLSVFGVDTSTLVTGAGILSIIIGLGSQQLIQDILAGLFIVFEGEFRVDDIVTIGDWRGTVLEIGLRTTKIMDTSKNIKIFSNSHISGVINMTREYSVAKVIVGTEYGDSIERIEAILQKELPPIKDKLPAIIDGPFYKGVAELAGSSVDLLIIATCQESDRMQLTRDLNREIKLIFDKNDINVPFPQITISELDDLDVTPTRKEKAKSKEFVEEQKELSEGIEIREEK